MYKLLAECANILKLTHSLHDFVRFGVPQKNYGDRKPDTAQLRRSLIKGRLH